MATGFPGRWSVVLPLALLLAVVVGCGSSTQRSLPKTYPVTGKVVVKGGQPLKGGTVQLTSPTTVTETITGEVQPDGTFALSTFNEKMKVAGAPEGNYTVTITPPPRADQNGPQPLTVPKPAKVEPRENTFTFEVPASWR